MNEESKYIIKPGDCIHKLAAQHGIPWQRIWNHPDNQELATKRRTPSILLPGDQVTVPPKEFKDEAGATEARHRFRKVTPKVEIRMEIRDYGQPRADEPYYVLINGKRYEGKTATTDANGLVVCSIPAATDVAVVVLGQEQTEYELWLGHVDPKDTPEGIHCRLQNLGFYEDEVDTPYDETTQRAYLEFLESMGESTQDRDTKEVSDVGNRVAEEYGS